METKCNMESCLLVTMHKEVLNKSDIKTITDENQMQLEDGLQIEDSCNMNIKTSLESNNTDIEIISQSSNHPNELEEIENPKISEATENNTAINVKELENINLEDTESANSTSLYDLQYDWSTAPKLLYVAAEEYQPTNFCEKFTKGCQWSPDGTCLLVPSEDFRIRLYELPREFYSDKIPSNFIQNNFTSALTVKEGGLIYDSCWYPYMNVWDFSTCCFLSTSKESPVHLWDAITGELHATYRAYNQLDEVESAFSIQFTNSASKIWSGFKNAVRNFDMNRPGRQINDIYFKHSFPNMSGLVSCIRENPIMPGLVAFGSYSKCIGIYKDGPICVFETGSGVTQVEFSSCGTKLYSAVRKNSEFLCWDLRNPGTVLYCLKGRQSDTNQRINFSFTPDNKYMISGGTDGNIIVWELPNNITTDNDEHLNPKYKIRLSKDCINGISLHKSLPILATSSGQRHHFEDIHRDNSVRLWWAS